VDHVKTEQNRDLEPRFERRPLKLVGHRRAANVERRTEQPFADHLQVLRAKIAVRFAIELLQLAELFRQRHSGDQRIYLTLDIGLLCLCKAAKREGR